jgi:hypothetical protein
MVLIAGGDESAQADTLKAILSSSLASMAVCDQSADASWFPLRLRGEVHSDIQPIGIAAQFFDVYGGYHSVSICFYIASST